MNITNISSETLRQLKIVALCAFSMVLHGIFYFYYNPLFISIPFADIPLIFSASIGSAPLLLEIARKVYKRDLGTDLLAGIAILTAFFMQEYLAANIVIIMLAGGEALELYAMRKASSALQNLASRMPDIAHLRLNGQITDIKVDEIKIGDHIAVYPHETCPVDGIVYEGYSFMDESYLTGEPYTIAKTKGVKVISGAINGDGLLIVEATQSAENSCYSKIIKVMEEAETKRPRLRRLADQIGAIFTPIAIITGIVAWVVSGESIRFLAVLVIATPCPLILGIPIAIVSAISIAASKSIIIKDPNILENMPLCEVAIFDKTGTLTYGKPSIQSIDCAENMSEQEALKIAASLEQYSKHPLAEAIFGQAQADKISLLEISQISERPGQGIFGIYNNTNISITSRNNFVAQFPDLKDKLPLKKSGLECLLIIENKFAALFTFRDQIRPEGKNFISHLRPNHNFKKVILLSGDSHSEVQYLADELEITDVYSQKSPKEKLDIVLEESKNFKTMYIGDGINDAPSLAAATVGIAFGNNNNVTSEAAGAVIMDNQLNRVDELYHISLIMRQIALQTAVGGMILSFVGMGFAAFGFISPVMGAIIQEIIDVVAILNALRLITKKDIHEDFNTRHNF